MKKFYFLLVMMIVASASWGQSVVVNKYLNTGSTTDQVELLVVQDNLDMRGMIIKDFSGNMVNDAGGKFTFTTDLLWSSVRAGTLIVLSNNPATVEDFVTSCTDFNLTVKLTNTTYFTNGGGAFDISTTEMIMIKAAGSGTAGVTSSIHVLAGGTAGAQYTAAASPKLRATGTSGTNQFVYANSTTQLIADYDGTDATGAATGLTLGSGNNANNTAFINFLRGAVSTAASSVGSNSFDANWNALPGAASYIIDVDDNSDFSSPLVGYTALNVGNVITYNVSGLSPLTTYYYRVRAVNATPTTSGNSCSQNIMTLAGATPIITVSVASLASFGAVVAGSNSAERTYNVSGVNLTANLNITAPAGVEVSFTSGSYTGLTGNTISLTPGGGTVALTPVYARFSPATATGFLNANISNTSTGATTKTVNVQGFAVVAEPTLQSTVVVSSFTNTDIGLTLSGGNGSSRIVVARQGSAVNVDPTDGPAYFDGGGIFTNGTDLGGGNYVVYIGNAGTTTVTNLTPGTVYHFAVYSFNSNGGAPGTMNYLTPGGTANGATSAATYTWSGGNSAWTTATNWTPTRTTPSATDILLFNTGTTVTVTAVPTQTIGKLLVSNSTIVNLQTSAANVLTIGGGVGADLDVESLSQLNITGTSALTINIATGATASISGNMLVSGAAHLFTAADANGITFNSGAQFTTSTGFTGAPFGGALGTSNSVIFSAGSAFVQNTGSNPFQKAQPASLVVFNPGSDFYFRPGGIAAPSLSGRVYANLYIENSTTISNSGAGNLQLHILNIEAGSSFQFTGTGTNTTTITGDILSAGTGNIDIAAGSGGIQLNSGATQTIGGGGGTGTISLDEVNISTGTTVNLLRNYSCSFITIVNGTLNAGIYKITGAGDVQVNGTVRTANDDGLASPGTFSITGTSSIGPLSTVYYDKAGGNQTLSSVYAYNALIIAGGGIKTADGNITVNNTLALNLGRIVIGNNNLVMTNSSTTAIAPYGVNGYIVTNGTGSLQRPVSAAGTYVFPVGHITEIQLAAITFGAPLGAANTLSARFIVSNTGGSNGLPLVESGDNINRTSLIGYWSVVAGSPFADVYNAAFTANGFGDIINYTKLHLLKRVNAASPWVLNGTHLPTIGSNASATLSRVGMSGFSEFGVGGENNISLPVNIVSFSGYKNGTANRLQWTTSSENNNTGFEVQRSTDGANYSAIGFVYTLAQGGNSATSLNYNFIDNNVAGNKQFYRLRQVDITNQSRFSNVISINGEKPLVLTLGGLYPNPAKDVVNAVINSPAKDKVTLLITDISGKVVLQKTAGVDAGSNTIPMDISLLNYGTYVIKLICSSNCEAAVGKFVKQ